MRPSISIVPAALLMLLSFSLPTSAAEAGGSNSGPPYLIHPGDRLAVSVWREENLTRAAPVLPDGMVSYPLVGTVMAAGKTVEEIQELFREKLSAYIPEPVVTVTVSELEGNKIYIIGQVIRPGEFVTNRYMDVVQALSLAGGMSPYASANNIKILRRKNGQLSAIPFRYGDIEKGKNLEQNIVLQSGDVVLVP